MRSLRYNHKRILAVNKRSSKRKKLKRRHVTERETAHDSNESGARMGK